MVKAPVSKPKLAEVAGFPDENSPTFDVPSTSDLSLVSVKWYLIKSISKKFQSIEKDALTRPGPDQIPTVAAHWGAKTPPNSYTVFSVTAHWGKNNPTAICVCIHMQLKVEEDS